MSSSLFPLSTPAGARTLDTLIKSQVGALPTELRVHPFSFAGAKVHTFSETTKLFREILSKKLYLRHFYLIDAWYGSPQGSHNGVASCVDRCFGSTEDAG